MAKTTDELRAEAEEQHAKGELDERTSKAVLDTAVCVPEQRLDVFDARAGEHTSVAPFHFRSRKPNGAIAAIPRNLRRSFAVVIERLSIALRPSYVWALPSRRRTSGSTSLRTVPSSWYVGLLALRSFGERLKLGAEVFHRTSVAVDTPATSGFNVGAIVKLTEGRNLLASVGRGVQGVTANRLSFYVAYQLEL